MEEPFQGEVFTMKKFICSVCGYVYEGGRSS